MAKSSNQGRAAEKCFACGRPITTDRGMHLVDTRDGQLAFVGGDCFAKVRAAGADGYQPPKGGPRLWLCEPTRAAA